MSVVLKPIQQSLHLSGSLFAHDTIVSQPHLDRLMLSDVLQLIFGDRLTKAARKSGQHGTFTGSIRPGWVHIGQDKQDLVAQQHTKFVRTYHTLLKLASKGYDYMTFGTFHARRRFAYERNRRNLNSCHAFVIDIDSKAWTVDAIVAFCAGSGLVPPTLINETDRGYHVWFVLDREMIGPHERLDGQQRSLTKAGQYYTDMNRHLIDLFAAAFPAEGDHRNGVDALVGGERYIRIPKNVSYYSGNRYSIHDFAQIKRELNLIPEKKIESKPKHQGRLYIPHAALRKDPAYEKLLNMQPAAGDRRYTAFTIALLFYACNLSKEQTTAFLEAWVSRLEDISDFVWKEVYNAIESAFSGKYRGPHHKWITRLTGLTPTVYFTRKLSAADRTYKTLSDWEEAFLQKLKNQGGVWTVSNRDLCFELSLTSRATLDRLIEALVERGAITRESYGRGRTAKTTYALLQPATPERKDDAKVVQLDVYRRSRRALEARPLNDPLSYRNLLESTRDGGREGFDLFPDPPDPGDTI